MEKGNAVPASRAFIDEGEVTGYRQKQNAVGKVMDVETGDDMKEETRIEPAHEPGRDEGEEKSDSDRKEDIQIYALIACKDFFGERVSASDFGKNTE
jgi:hypothetical protein